MHMLFDFKAFNKRIIKKSQKTNMIDDEGDKAYSIHHANFTLDEDLIKKKIPQNHPTHTHKVKMHHKIIINIIIKRCRYISFHFVEFDNNLNEWTKIILNILSNAYYIHDGNGSDDNFAFQLTGGEKKRSKIDATKWAWQKWWLMH